MSRSTDNAVFRNAAMTCGIASHHIDEVSSPSRVSRIQYDLFSIDQSYILESQPKEVITLGFMYMKRDTMLHGYAIKARKI